MSEEIKRPKGRPATTEKMKAVTFHIRPSDYELLREAAEELGLNAGAGIRFALTEFLRNRGKK